MSPADNPDNVTRGNLRRVSFHPVSKQLIGFMLINKAALALVPTRINQQTMQYFTNNGILLIGKHKGKLFLDLPKQYSHWAKTNLPGYKEQLKTIAKLLSKQPIESTGKWLSTNGQDRIANKGFRKPNPKRFTSRAQRPINY